MREQLSSTLSEIAKQDLTQNEREAIIELMMMTMYSDKNLKLAEDEIIQKYVSNIKWESPLSLDFYFGKVTPKIRTALQDKEKMSDFLTDINNRLESEAVKSQVLQLCNDLAIADADFSSEEKELLEHISQVFQINA
ncbi:tellurite resistance TerB family protein [Plectonema cf. radiosum LEGE 06105]|uniref:Tellurite resistance TerB family protein n=1 Tax=Plectonema cf. radiosum LEGE 06105 TaxID=945769 RepID=A0A8J7K161_9CYAN|nr:TerB family tellurite resistance protein [Plectonema radiosum]MBE9211467.1 tellurite resistance TerB family protein [Plectonema cf. radiosum LEGE 06105]